MKYILINSETNRALAESNGNLIAFESPLAAFIAAKFFLKQGMSITIAILEEDENPEEQSLTE